MKLCSLHFIFTFQGIHVYLLTNILNVCTNRVKIAYVSSPAQRGRTSGSMPAAKIQVRGEFPCCRL